MVREPDDGIEGTSSATCAAASDQDPARKASGADSTRQPKDGDHAEPSPADNPSARDPSAAAATAKRAPRPARTADSQRPREPSKQTSAAPKVLGADVKTAKRVSLYLHPDDHRRLLQARVDDGADINARLRAMIALWRTNPRVRAQVDRLARVAPRGSR